MRTAHKEHAMCRWMASLEQQPFRPRSAEDAVAATDLAGAADA
jgi:hypothetical protein